MHKACNDNGAEKCLLCFYGPDWLQALVSSRMHFQPACPASGGRVGVKWRGCSLLFIDGRIDRSPKASKLRRGKHGTNKLFKFESN
ncbi:hypothetical protein vseg_001487 [Gypsophila vaccaria]